MRGGAQPARGSLPIKIVQTAGSWHAAAGVLFLGRTSSGNIWGTAEWGACQGGWLIFWTGSAASNSLESTASQKGRSSRTGPSLALQAEIGVRMLSPWCRCIGFDSTALPALTGRLQEAGVAAVPLKSTTPGRLQAQSDCVYLMPSSAGQHGVHPSTLRQQHSKQFLACDASHVRTVTTCWNGTDACQSLTVDCLNEAHEEHALGVPHPGSPCCPLQTQPHTAAEAVHQQLCMAGAVRC